jgi:hypothetical protein
VHKDGALPSSSLTMGLLDFGDLEVQTGDGKTQREKRRQLLFVPLHDSAASDLCSGAKPLGDPGILAPISKRKRGFVRDTNTWNFVQSAIKTFSSMVSVHKADGVWERYAPLTSTGDIQLCLVHSLGGGDNGNGSAGGGDESDGSVRKRPNGGGSGTMFLDIYGDNVPTRLNVLMEEIMDFAEAVTAGGSSAKIDPQSKGREEVKKKLFWLDLACFNNMYRVRERLEPKPDFLKKPIHGNLEYQQEYHHSFFHVRFIIHSLNLLQPPTKTILSRLIC